ncbi:CapA family protein [Tissierella sp. MB52-C2]|uniref:CapA family protein n=1 Tax=Tissierella sp. MB52-C2 TaxID=3070999 RepID=UPI00280AE300|nr:CapA family protein [Tissierella sp. MB52-C2]WMM25317.1 CapA family protein [Tissierella sp. MB52-C2]
MKKRFYLLMSIVGILLGLFSVKAVEVLGSKNDTEIQISEKTRKEKKEEPSIEAFESIDETEETCSLSISLIGDILMDGSVKIHINKNGFNYPWDRVKEYFQNDDITIGNLETSITTKGQKWPDKQFNFRSDPRNIKAMEEAGIDIVSLSNNHSLDYGYDGLMDTLKYIDNSKIKRVGGGYNKKDAINGTIVEKNGIKVGVLGFSRVVPDVKWYATDKRAGIVGAYDPHIEEVTDRVMEMKKEADIMVLAIHWGVERSDTPRKQEMDLAKRLIDSGVDIVMGHHPHVLQGVEIYKGKPIFYSLGNFVFGTSTEITSNTMIAQVNLINKNIDNIKIIPCEIVSGRPIPLDNNKNAEKINYLHKISKNFKTNIDKDGLIKIVKE